MVDYRTLDRATGNGKKVELVEVTWREPGARNPLRSRLRWLYSIEVTYTDEPALDFSNQFTTKRAARRNFKCWSKLTTADLV